MKIWICRISILLNLLVIAAVLTGLFFRADIISGFLKDHREHRISMFEQYPLKQGELVVVGDSITEQGPWEDMFPDHAIRNRGIGGETTTGLLKRLDEIVSSNPRALFLKIGTNDLTHGPGIAMSYTQYREIVSRIRTESPGTRLHLQSLLPRGVEYRESVEDFNREIREIAGEFDATYIDLYPGFLARDGSIDNIYSSDELHLNGPGYALWREQIEAEL